MNRVAFNFWAIHRDERRERRGAEKERRGIQESMFGLGEIGAITLATPLHAFLCVPFLPLCALCVHLYVPLSRNKQ